MNRRIDVAGCQPIARGCLAIDIDAKRRLPQRREYRKVGDAADFAHRLFDFLRGLSQHNHVIADQLHRVLAFDAGYSFLDVVLDVLREVEVDARKFRLQSCVDLLDELVLGHTLAPLLGRLQRRKELGIEEACRIGAVIGASLLGHDGLDFGKTLDHQPYAVDEVVALLERNRRRHGCANPEIALLQMRQEFEAQKLGRKQRERQEQASCRECQNPMYDRKFDHRGIEATQNADDHRLRLAQALVEQVRAEGGHDRKSCDQGPGKRIGVGLRHWAEYVAFDAAQREQWNEADDYDRGGKKDRAVDLGRRAEDRCEFSRKAGRSSSSGGPIEGRAFRKMSKNVLHHDDAGIDDETEINCPNREKVGGFSPQHQDAHCEGEGERNSRRHDEGAAQISQKNPLNEKNQNHAEDQVEKDGVGGQVNEVAAIVNAFDPHARRENSRRIDLLDFFFNATDRRQALLAASHQHDSLYDIVLLVPAGNSEARLVSNDDLRDITEKDRIAVCCRQHGVADIVHRANEADAAYDGRLLADVDGVTADIDVAVVHRLQNLRQREAIGHELFAVDLDFKCLGLAAPAGHVDDARHGAESAR